MWSMLDTSDVHVSREEQARPAAGARAREPGRRVAMTSVCAGTGEAPDRLEVIIPLGENSGCWIERSACKRPKCPPKKLDSRELLRIFEKRSSMNKTDF